MSKQYRVLRRLGSRTGSKQWNPGDVIHLSDAQADVHLRRGNVEALPEQTADLLPVQRVKRQRRKVGTAGELTPPSAATVASESEEDNGTTDSG
jgi:hypothetical protein